MNDLNIWNKNDTLFSSTSMVDNSSQCIGTLIMDLVKAINITFLNRETLDSKDYPDIYLKLRKIRYEDSKRILPDLLIREIVYKDRNVDNKYGDYLIYFLRNFEKEFLCHYSKEESYIIYQWLINIAQPQYRDWCNEELAEAIEIWEQRSV
jgi:hypothetical protein